MERNYEIHDKEMLGVIQCLEALLGGYKNKISKFG